MMKLAEGIVSGKRVIKRLTQKDLTQLLVFIKSETKRYTLHLIT